MTKIEAIPALLDALETLYDQSVGNLRSALQAFASDGTRPDAKARAGGAFAYPELRVDYDPTSPPAPSMRAFARLSAPGRYTSSIARPRLFRAYLTEQLEHLVRDYPVEISVGRSASEIAYPYVLDGGELELGGLSTAELSRWFPSTELAHIGDEVADGEYDLALADEPPAGSVRRPAHRLQPRPAEALYGHPAGRFPALHPVHQLRPLRRRIRPSSRSTPCAGPTVRSPASRSPAGPSSAASSRMPRRRSPPARGVATRCRPIIS